MSMAYFSFILLLFFRTLLCHDFYPVDLSICTLHHINIYLSIYFSKYVENYIV